MSPKPVYAACSALFHSSRSSPLAPELVTNYADLALAFCTFVMTGYNKTKKTVTESLRVE